MICAGKEILLGRHTSDFQQQFYLLGMSSLLRNMKCFVLLVECFVLLVEGIGGGNPLCIHIHGIFCAVDGMFLLLSMEDYVLLVECFVVVDGVFRVVAGSNWG